MSTNITDEHREAFEALRDPSFKNFALFSCEVGDEPTSAIVSVNEDGDDYVITPIFVAVTPKILGVIKDHDGKGVIPLDLQNPNKGGNPLKA